MRVLGCRTQDSHRASMTAPCALLVGTFFQSTGGVARDSRRGAQKNESTLDPTLLGGLRSERRRYPTEDLLPTHRDSSVPTRLRGLTVPRCSIRSARNRSRPLG